MEDKQTEEILYGGNTNVVVRVGDPIGSIPLGLYGDRRLGAPVKRPDDGLTVIDWDFCGPGDPIDDLASRRGSGFPCGPTRPTRPPWLAGTGEP